MACRRTNFKGYVDELQQHKDMTKPRVMAKIEHPFRIGKLQPKAGACCSLTA
jgi:hypothetical protein